MQSQKLTSAIEQRDEGYRALREGRLSDAIRSYDLGLAGLAGVRGRKARLLRVNLSLLKAAAMLNLPDHAKALDLAQDARETLLRISPDGSHPQVLSLLASANVTMATALRSRGEAEKALDLLRDAIRLWEETIGDGHQEFVPELASAHLNMGNALVHVGSLNEALRSYRCAIELRRTLMDQGATDARGEIGKATAYLASVLQELGRRQEAEKELESALRLLREEVQGGRTVLAGVLEWAERYRRDMHAGRQDQPTPFAPLRDYYLDQVEKARQQGDLAKATYVARRALEILRSRAGEWPGDKSVQNAIFHFSYVLVELYELRGMRAQAEELQSDTFGPYEGGRLTWGDEAEQDS